MEGFLPSSILSLRTAKADVMVGLEPGQAEKVTEQDPEWMVDRDRAVGSGTVSQ